VIGMVKGSDFELDDYTPEELRMAEELDRAIDQIEGLDVESELALDLESARWLAEMRQILARVKGGYDELVERAEPLGKEELIRRIREEAERMGLARRSIWGRMAEGIKRAFSSQPVPQPAYRREEVSDLRIHGEELLRNAFIVRARVGGRLIENVIAEGEYLIGSSPEADIHIDDPNRYVSRRHARLILRGGQLFIVDLGSTNGTFVNGRRIEPGEEVRVTPEDRIELADVPLEIRRF